MDDTHLATASPAPHSSSGGAEGEGAHENHVERQVAQKPQGAEPLKSSRVRVSLPHQ